MYKRIILVLLIIICTMNNRIFAAVVSDNDGSAFITKAEYDSLKNSFQAQLNSYNSSIDAKIDEAIASYLAGVDMKPSGEFDPCDIENYNNIQWRDKLIIKNVTMRRWTNATTYTDISGKNWEADYDTILMAGTNAAMSSINVKIPAIWSIFQPNGYGGVEWLIKGELSKQALDGKNYWVACGSGDSYRQPSYPLIYYTYDEFNKDDKKNVKRLKGWGEWGNSFTGISTHETDDSICPDGTRYWSNNTWGTPINLKNTVKGLAIGTKGRDTNCFGLKVLSGSGAEIGGIRPKKNATEFFPRWQEWYNSSISRCDYVTSFPQSYPLVGRKIDESDENLCKMMCGSENTQEVNYITESTGISFWNSRPLWPDDCFKEYTFSNINARKMMIYQHPNGPWTNAQALTDMPLDQVFQNSYAGVFKFTTLPDSMTISMPTKPHKKLKLLETNFFTNDGESRLRFGDGLPVVKNNYKKCTITLEFEVSANDGYSTSTFTPYIELKDTDFNSNGNNFEVKDSAAISGKPKCYKIKIGKNTILFDAKANQTNVWARFSPGDNSGLNYLKISNIKATFKGID